MFYADVPAFDLAVTEFPHDLNSEKYVPETAVCFSSVSNLPAYEEFSDLFGNDIDWDDYDAAVQRFGVETDCDTEEICKLLGYADLIQGSIIWECEMIAEGFYCGKPAELTSAQKEHVRQRSADWVLLAQFGTLSDELMFGDCGSIYFHIRKVDLKNRHFGNIHLSLQCG